MRGIGGTLFRLDYLLGAAIVACQLLDLQGLTSIFFYATFPVSFALWICAIAHGFDRTDGLAIATVLLALLHVAANAFLSDADFSFSYLKKYAMFCNSVIFLDAVRRVQVSRADYRLLKLLYLSVGVLMLALYWMGVPAACALMVAKVLLLLSVAVAEGVFLYRTESRNALLAVITFAVLLCFRPRRRRKAGFSRGFLGLMSVAPLLFAGLYMRVVDAPFFARFFSFATAEGKELNSRTDIWEPAFRRFASSPVLGAYCQISNGTGMSQLHNTHVDILVSYGTSVLVLTCVFLYVLMRDLRTEVSDDALVGFICVLLLGIGEAALFSGGRAGAEKQGGYGVYHAQPFVAGE